MNVSTIRTLFAALLVLSVSSCGGESDGDGSTDEVAEGAGGSSAAEPMSTSGSMASMDGETANDPGDSDTGGDSDSPAVDPLPIDADADDADDDVSDIEPEDEPAASTDDPQAPDADDEDAEPAFSADGGVDLPPGLDEDSLPMVDDSGQVVNPDGCPEEAPEGSCDGSASACVYDDEACGCVEGEWQCLDTGGFDPGDFGMLPGFGAGGQ